MHKIKLEEIFFSHLTFQGVCKEASQEYYPLIQVNEDNELTSVICSCGSNESVCAHAQILYEAIITAPLRNLSLDYHESFIRVFFYHFFYFHEETSCDYKHAKGELSCQFGEDLVKFHACDEELKKIKAILTNTEIKDETNSLEFSSLPENELKLYQSNRPSFNFRFALSVYNDLAKHFFLKNRSYRLDVDLVRLTQDQAKLQLRLDGLVIEAFVRSALVQELIPDLDPKMTTTPLHQGSIDYKVELAFGGKGEGLKITRKKRALPKGLEMGDYVFVEGQGFYAKQLDPIFQQDHIQDIATFFTKYKAHIQELLVGISVHPYKYKAHYELTLTPSGDLEIFLDRAGPLKFTALTDHLFKPFVLIDNHTIVELEGVVFDELSKVIKKKELKTFLNRHKQFLKEYPGFSWHMVSIAEHIDYLFEGDVLEFIQKPSDEQTQDVIDCGDFIYVYGHGFYPKVSQEGGSKIVSGLKVLRPNIESFLHENWQDLALVRGFFSLESPLENVVLKVELSDKGQLVTYPMMVLKPGYHLEDVVWLGSYTFTKGEGFKQVPSALKMPVLFSHPAKFGLHELFGLLDLLQTSLKDRLQIDSRLKIPTSLKLELSEISEEKPYLALGYYCSDLGRTPLAAIKKAYEKGERSLCTEAGLIDLTDERFGFLKFITLSKEGYFSIDPLSFYKLALYEDVSFAEALKGHPFMTSLNFEQDAGVLELKGYTSSLRPYQETGVRWLQNLYRLGLSGLLCDEMGLGKTHQAIAFIAVIAHQKTDPKILIVCPTSVLYHWEKQLKSYLAHQKVSLFHGQSRQFDPAKFKGGIVLTSYGVLRSDIALFSEIGFDLAIYDELQIAKNPHSKIYAALSKVPTAMKLGLSGTPIENTIEDLKALFDLILPKLLPKSAEFKEKFLIPIEKNYDKKARQRLNKVTAPFIMRRLKKDVLKDLPEKVETDMLCEMTPFQEAFYHKVVSEQKAAVLTRLCHDKEGTLHVFALLTKLKQLCDHPSLIEPQIDPFKEEASGKWELFKELLQEARDSGQKVVVFSQYLEMLNIIESYLKKLGVGFASLRGSSMDRAAQVKRFQEDPSCQVFVGSLLASGVGIDLTAASVVIHYDRWWNPAKEAQATDRVHRIGQNRGVQVFKLITKDTIEERIDWLIKDKLRLIETLNTDEGPDLFKNFTKKELLQLVESLN